MTVGPNPFSREGSRPGDGLGEVNRFETLADGATPQFDGPPTPPQPDLPAAAAPCAEPSGPAAQPYPEPSGPMGQPYPDPSGSGFPSYPYAEQPPAPLSPYPPQPGFGQPQPYQPVPAGYPAPNPSGYPYGRLLQNSPYATVALVTGILGACCGITGPLAVGFGLAALHQIKREPQVYGGRGLAIGGLITGLIGSLWLTWYIVVMLSV